MNWKNLFKKHHYNPLKEEIIAEYNRHRPLGPQPIACYAPFRSIYFGHHGKATACCYNRTYVLGQYPNRSIKDIWFGEEANKLRDYLKHDDFSLGCAGCKQQLVAANFDAVKAKQYDERKENKNHYPSVMEFELSNTCNLECEMCSGDFSSLIRAKREKLPPLESPYDDNFVKQLEAFLPYLEEVKFYGGEPFLIEIYYQIWEKIMEINPAIRISVQTNATVLNNRVKKILANTHFHINVSFDSLQKETYEQIRKNAEFERTSENLKWFSEYCKERHTFFGISVCAMRNNWRELPDFITFCNAMEVPVYFHTVMYPHHMSIHNLPEHDLSEIVKHLSQFDFPEDNPVQKKNKKHFTDTLNQFKLWQAQAPRTAQLRNTRLKSLAELEELLTTHITQDKSQTEAGKAQKIKQVREKITALQERIPAELLEPTLQGLDLTDPLFFDTMTVTLQSLSVEQLISMAHERINA